MRGDAMGLLAGGLPDSASCDQEVSWPALCGSATEVCPIAEVEIWGKEELREKGIGEIVPGSPGHVF
jgi:hypothetical protein